MNAISFGALLGAATWFGSKFTEEESAPAAEAEAPRPVEAAPPPRFAAADETPEFLWLSGSEFQ